MTSIDLRDRALHLLDLENLGRGPQCSATWLNVVLRRLDQLASAGPADLRIGAASHWMVKRVAFDLPLGLRLLPAGGGPDAADLRLIDEVDPMDISHRFTRVIIGSGDGVFAHLAGQLRAAGLRVVVASHRNSLSPVLRAAADEVVLLDAAWTLAA